MQIRHGTAAVSGDNALHVLATGRETGWEGGSAEVDPQVRRPGSHFTARPGVQKRKRVYPGSAARTTILNKASESGQKESKLNTHRILAPGVVFAALALCCASHPARAQSLATTQVKPGYHVESVELGVPFGGAITHHPTNENLLYVSAGPYSVHTVLEVNVDTGTTRTLTPVVGNVGGLAMLSNGDLAIVENSTSDTILRARDLDSDGAFLSPGEITELIAPDYVEINFTGAQAIVAPAGNAAGIPAGSLLVQTADGSASSEILVIQDPETSPSYFPGSRRWFGGFEYNGGLAFTSAGHVLCGTSSFPTGQVLALVNEDADNFIGAEEAFEIVGPSVLSSSISDLTATHDGKMITTENSGTVRLFELPADLTSGSATPSVLLETNGNYLSAVSANYPSRSFTPGAAGEVATVYVGGYVNYVAGASNLLAITPIVTPAAAQEWQLFQ